MSISSLPTSLDDWREVLVRAFSLPPSRVMVSTKFAIQDVRTGEIATHAFGMAPAFDAARQSAILMALWSPDTSSTFRSTASGQPRPSNSTGAAVRSDVIFNGRDLVFPMTIRGRAMRSHAAQAAFPGGRVDAGETVRDAACREAMEEIGLRVQPNMICGELSLLYSFPSQSYVTPLVALLPAAQRVTVASPEEVESVHLMSLGCLLLDERYHHRIERTWSRGTFSQPAFYTNSGELVWGLTAFALVELLSRVATVLRGNQVAVSRGLRDAHAAGSSDHDDQRYIPFVNPYAIGASTAVATPAKL